MAGSPLPEHPMAAALIAGLDAYARAFADFSRSLPLEDLAERQAQLRTFLDHGFPGKHLERWRYTDLEPLNQQVFAVAGDDQSLALGAALIEFSRLPKTDGLVYVNGVLDEALSSAPELSQMIPAAISADTDPESGLFALNAAFASEGLNLELGANTRIARPLHLVLASGGTPASTMTHQRHRITLGAHAQATVIVDFRGISSPSGDASSAAHPVSHLATHHVEIVLGENAQLTLYRVQSDTADGILLTRIDIEIAAHARLAAVCVDAGAGFCRHDLNAQLNGPGAEIELNGLYHPISHAAAGETPRRAHIDNHTCIIHAQPHGRSRESFRGIVDERARAVFNGKVVVMPDAQKTDSEQRIATLLLSRRAEANAKPELEIHADDVRCAHGATVGQLDATALAYLRSRGIDPATARALLLQAFAMQILDKIAIPSLRADLCRRLGLPGDDGAVETLPPPLANPAIPA